MKPLIDPINTSDGKFHGKDKQTGDLATVVTPEYMNNDQDATRSMQREIISILTSADIKPEEATDTQLLTALKKVLITADDERVKNALQKEKNLSDVSDAAKARENLELGSAAVANVTASNVDVTNGRVLKVGDYGLGVANGSVPLLNSIYDIKCSGEYNALGDGASTPTTGIPAGVGNTRFAVSAGNIFSNQYLVTLTSNVHFYVGVVDTAKKTSTWSKFYNTSNKPSANDVGAIPTAIVGSISNNGSMANAKINGWWQIAVSDPKTVPGFPKHPDGTYLYGYGYMFNWVIGAIWFQLYYAHHGENATRQNWSAGPDTATAWVIGYNTVSKPTASDVGAYTKSESDTKFQPKGNYTPTGTAYTKAESDARYNLKNTASLTASGGWQQDGTTGLIIQMGIVNRTTFGTNVTFPKAFPNYCYGVLLTLNSYIDSLDDSTYNIRALNHSKTGFTYGAAGDAEKTAFWVAFGK